MDVYTDVLLVFLIVSELPFFRGYFSRNWPLLSMSSGFVTLGVFMIVVGVSILGNLNKEATSQESLGLPFWRIVISSGIVTVVLGVVNIVVVSPFLFVPFSFDEFSFYLVLDLPPKTGLTVYFQSFIFRTPSLGVTSRMIRSYGAVAPQKVDDIVRRSPSGRHRRSFHLNRTDTLPSYHTSPKTTQMSSTNPNTCAGGLNISAPLNVDQNQFAKFNGSDEVKRPDLACHPALQGGRF